MPIPEHGEGKFCMSLRDTGMPAHLEPSRDVFLRLIDALSEQGHMLNAHFFHCEEAGHMLRERLLAAVGGRACLPGAEILAASRIPFGDFLGRDYHDRRFPNLRRLLAGVVFDSQLVSSLLHGPEGPTAPGRPLNFCFNWWDREVICRPTNGEKGLDVSVFFRYESEKSAGIEMIKLAEAVGLRPFYDEDEISMEGVEAPASDPHPNNRERTSPTTQSTADNCVTRSALSQEADSGIDSPALLKPEKHPRDVRWFVENAQVVPAELWQSADDPFVGLLAEEELHGHDATLLRPVREYVEKLLESIEAHLAEQAGTSEKAMDPN